MILDTFRHRGIKRFVFILLCIIVLFWQKITVFPEINSIQPIIPVDTIFNLLTGKNVYLSAFVKILLLLVCSYAFIAILSLHDVLPKRKYLAAMLFLCIISVLIDAHNIVGSVCALFFQLFAFYNLFRTYHSDRIKSAVFTAAFFAGISILFSFSFTITIINLIIGMWIFSVITWRSIISMILGLLTPFMFLLYFFQLAYHDASLMLRSIENNANSLFFNMFDFDNFSAFFMGFVFFITLLSLLKASKYTKPIQRMINQLFYFLFVTSALMTIFIFDMKSYSIMLFGISAAYLLTRFSQHVKREWIAEIIVFSILIASVVYNNYLVFFY
ncbi:MAG: hypothetical protein LBS69_02925 [Prevotellaceae bacterium]|jgi:hypothetical protein|nr:hypothetical protein [Prevotellaceae bacterium]